MNQKSAPDRRNRTAPGKPVTAAKDGVAAGGHAIVEMSAPLDRPVQVVRRFRRGHWTLTTIAV